LEFQNRTGNARPFLFGWQLVKVTRTLLRVVQPNAGRVKRETQREIANSPVETNAIGIRQSEKLCAGVRRVGIPVPLRRSHTRRESGRSTHLDLEIAKASALLAIALRLLGPTLSAGDLLDVRFNDVKDRLFSYGRECTQRASDPPDAKDGKQAQDVA
jgi:hypothetical protein